MNYNFPNTNKLVDSVIQARERAADFIRETPLEHSDRLSKLYDANIYLKREDRTKVRSYKIRWAFNLISWLSDKEKEVWVVCASAGNHAQWFAIVCAYLKIHGTVFMPVTTPEQKVHKTKKFGWEYLDVRLVWDTFDAAFAESEKFEEETGATFVHPFDDPKIIEGQAGVWIEILAELDDTKPDYLIVPIGWWGLSAGLVGIFHYLSPQTKIIWVEPEWAPAMLESIKKWERVQLDHIEIFVDGAAVKQVWENNFEILRNSDIEICTVPENRICTTILDFLKEDGIIVEPAGALSTDVLKDMRNDIKWKTVVCVVSGGNFDFERLPEVKERSMKYEGLKRYFIINFPQRPGALKDFLSCLGPNDDIARFEYLKKSNKNKAPVFIWIETDDPKNWDRICKIMWDQGFRYTDITHDEIVFDLLV